MGLGKWIGGVMGFMAMGPLGALAGFAIGSLFDSANNQEKSYDGEDDLNDNQSYQTGQRNSFLFSMLVMASYIIKADGRIMHSEMEFVRQFLRINFGELAVNQGEQILLNLFEQRKRMDQGNPWAFRNKIHFTINFPLFHFSILLSFVFFFFLYLLLSSHKLFFILS